MAFLGAIIAAALLPGAYLQAGDAALTLTEKGYLEMPGLSVMLASDYYPEGHQGGVGVIQNGMRTATNGDLRLEQTPGQWAPIPKPGKRNLDREHAEIQVRMDYPDDSRNRKGFNPIDYPDLKMGYKLRILPEGSAFRIIVDLDQPLPATWVGKVGFNFELYPGILFGKTYSLDSKTGIFPRQANGPGAYETDGSYHHLAMASGRKLVVAPESEEQRMNIEVIKGGDMSLIDGRGQHTNGWFVVRSLVPADVSVGAIEWLVTPHAIKDFRAKPIIQVSQVGYHPAQPKVAVIELDAREKSLAPLSLLRISDAGALEPVLTKEVPVWGNFLRYQYLRFDFSEITKPGMYMVRYGEQQSQPFQINSAVYRRDVWQPTLETFLPALMCHMRVNDRYRVWHGFCHMDDALMAPINYNHFDGYIQGPSTLTKYKSGEHVPGLDRGGWHDAGDFDLRIESQTETMRGLALAYELFKIDYDNTTIDQEHQAVEMHRPDGKPDILQQIEHGALSVIGGYKSMGRLYRGIQTPTLHQYTMLGDGANMTDNVVFKDVEGRQPPPVGLPGSRDDNWVFTEDNPRNELLAAAGLAASYRALKDFNPSLAQDCLTAAKELWDRAKPSMPGFGVAAAVELLITTGDSRYSDFLVKNAQAIAKTFSRTGGSVARSLPYVKDEGYSKIMADAAKAYGARIADIERKSPYGIPYEPQIWGAGWEIQHFGVEQYFLHVAYPELFHTRSVYSALNFILGVHPGSNTASFVSGVGVKSATTAYGPNRADNSYVPGGIISGTALIRPDFPELLEWPYLWQQTEYCLGGSTSEYIFLVHAVEKLASGEGK